MNKSSDVAPAMPQEPSLVEQDSPGGSAADPRRSFVLALGRALHRYGTPAHRLEAALAEVSRTLGMEANFLALPTALFSAFPVAVGDGGEQRVWLARQRSGEVDLSKLSELDALAQRVLAGGVTAVEGSVQVAEIVERAPRFGALATLLGGGLVSAGFALLFDAGWREVAASGIGGMLLGLVHWALSKRPGWLALFEPLGAFTVTFFAFALASRIAIAPSVVALASVIAAVPGLIVTRAVTELAQGSLVSGAARFFEAMLIFMMLALGAGMGAQLATSVLGPSLSDPGATPLFWWTPLAVALSGLAFVVLFRAAARDTGWIVAVGFVGFFLSAGASRLGGPALGAFCGSLAVGACSNLYARRLHRPALVTRVPGLMLLVPGSVGYRAITLFAKAEAVQGLQMVFAMAMAAVGLAAGLLFANVLVPSRRDL